MGYKGLLGISIAILSFDILTKLLISSFLTINDSIEIIPNLFNIVYIRNPGIAFGLFRDLPHFIRMPLLATLSFIAIAVILYIYHISSKEKWLEGFALSLILGGAGGNLIDRIRYGEVIDFIDLHVGRYHWPAFNIADTAVTIGAGILIFNLFYQALSSQRVAK